MTGAEINKLLEKQREFYRTGSTIPVNYRITQLKKLYAAVNKYEAEINDALKTDLGKSYYEGFMCETGLVLSEISYMIRHTKSFAKRKTVYTPLAQFASHSYKQPVPYGNTLIMSPWNYPFLLTIDPLADSIAAGNTAIVKPSAYSANILTAVKPVLHLIIFFARTLSRMLLSQRLKSKSGFNMVTSRLRIKITARLLTKSILPACATL